MEYIIAIILLLVLIDIVERATRKRHQQSVRQHHAPWIDADMWRDWHGR